MRRWHLAIVAVLNSNGARPLSILQGCHGATGDFVLTEIGVELNVLRNETDGGLPPRLWL